MSRQTWWPRTTRPPATHAQHTLAHTPSSHHPRLRATGEADAAPPPSPRGSLPKPPALPPPTLFYRSIFPPTRHDLRSLERCPQAHRHHHQQTMETNNIKVTLAYTTLHCIASSIALQSVRIDVPHPCPAISTPQGEGGAPSSFLYSSTHPPTHPNRSLAPTSTY